MGSEEIQRTKRIILSLFALTVSPELVNEIHNDSILRNQVRYGPMNIKEALYCLFTSSRSPEEYQKFELENKHYHYINPSILLSLKDVVSDRVLSPLPLPFSPE